jgi:hypothetical protein
MKNNQYQLNYTDKFPQNLMFHVRQIRDDIINLFKNVNFKIRFHTVKRLLFFNTSLEEKIPIGITVLENYFKTLVTQVIVVNDG